MTFLYGYAAFALVGQRILIYPLNRHVTVTGLFVLVATWCWVIPVMRMTVYAFERLGRFALQKAPRAKDSMFFICVLLMLLLPAVYHLIAFNPGISTLDTKACMVRNAHNLYGMEDWHPAFYCMVLRAIQKVWDSTYAVIFVQWFFWAYVMLELLRYLRKKGVRDGILYTVALFCGINAGNFAHLNTIWKDIPYALSLLWLVVLAAKLTIDQKEYLKRWYIYLELVVALTGIFFYRKNGVVVFVIFAVGMVFCFRRNRRAWAALLASILMICIVKGPVYTHFAVQDVGRRGMYIGLSQDILGTYYAGGEVSENTLQMIGPMTDYNIAEHSYMPTYAGFTYNLDVAPGEFIAAYLDTFVRNPVLLIRAVVAREDAIWNIFAGQDTRLGCVNCQDVEDGDANWNEYYPRRVYTGVYDQMQAMTNYTAISQWISAVEWRSGLFTLLGITACVYVLLKRGMRDYALIVFPIAGQILSLMFSTGWSDFRYFWPLNLANSAVCLLVFLAAAEKKEKRQ